MQSERKRCSTKDEDEKGRESREESVREPATRTASWIHASGRWCVLDPSSSASSTVEKWSRHHQLSGARGYKSRAYYHNSQGEYSYGIRLLLLSANSLQPRLQLLLLYSVPFFLVVFSFFLHLLLQFILVFSVFLARMVINLFRKRGGRVFLWSCVPRPPPC